MGFSYNIEKRTCFLWLTSTDFCLALVEGTTKWEVYIRILEKYDTCNSIIKQREDFLLYIRAVKETDYEKGVPCVDELSMYYHIEKMDGYYRIGRPENIFCYLVGGISLKDMFRLGFVTVVISREIKENMDRQAKEKEKTKR